MLKQTRHKLHFGPYRTPQFKYGAKVEDQIRGTVRIVALSAGPILWPLGRKDGARAMPVVFRGLERAIRRES